MYGFADHRQRGDLLCGWNILEDAAIGTAHLCLVVFQAEEQLQAGDQCCEQTDVLHISIDLLKIEIVAQIGREIGQRAENQIQKQKQFLRENIRVILNPECEIVD